jgi:hypothetical protein
MLLVRTAAAANSFRFHNSPPAPLALKRHQQQQLRAALLACNGRGMAAPQRALWRHALSYTPIMHSAADDL